MEGLEKKKEEGLDYMFMIMSATYGSMFNRHWDGVDFDIVRQVWRKTLDEYLADKEVLDHALDVMNSTYIPSAIEFRNLCKEYFVIQEEKRKKERKSLPYQPKYEPDERSMDQKELDRVNAEIARAWIKDYLKIGRVTYPLKYVIREGLGIGGCGPIYLENKDNLSN